jgi:hypothetical protein
MKSRTKIWLGVGAFVVAGAGASAGTPVAQAPALDRPRTDASDIALSRALSRPVQLAAMAHQKGTKQDESGEEGGEKGATNLPPDLDFALKIAQIRGHLRVGDELVKEKQWAAALPHFLHPSEELYGPLQPKLKDYKVPPFATALKLLANVVKTKKGGADYTNALKTVNDALAAADAGLKEKQKDWNAFTVETAIEVVKSATHEYEQAIVKGRIAKPVEYQDARGFVWQSEAMIEGIAAALEQKDKDALAHVRASFAELKKAWPTAMPPKTPVKDYAAVLSDVSRIELSAGKLM